MNRITTAALLLLLFTPNHSQSQLLKAVGIKIALTSADQRFDYTYMSGFSTKRRIGNNAALFAEWSMSPNLSCLTQLEYSQRGMGLEFRVVSEIGPEPLREGVEYNRLDYLSVPILLKEEIETSHIQPYLLMGPRVDYLVGYTAKGFSTVYDQFHRAILGWSFAVGIESTMLLSHRLSFEARYNLDLTNSYETELLKVNNNAYDFWLGVAL